MTCARDDSRAFGRDHSAVTSTELGIYREVQRFLSQPFFVAEIFTGTPGKFVHLATTVSDFDEVLSETCDDIPEATFNMVGSLADLKRRLRAWPRPLQNET